MEFGQWRFKLKLVCRSIMSNIYKILPLSIDWLFKQQIKLIKHWNSFLSHCTLHAENSAISLTQKINNALLTATAADSAIWVSIALISCTIRVTVMRQTYPKINILEWQARNGIFPSKSWELYTWFEGGSPILPWQNFPTLHKAGRIHIWLNHMPITKIHLLAATMTRRRFLQILSTRTFRYLFETSANIFKMIYFAKWKEL